MRRLAFVLVVFFATASSATAAGKLHVKIVGQDHRPKVGAKWRYSVTVTDAKTGKRVACRIHLEFLFGSIPIGQVGTHLVKSGFWQETFGTPGNPAFPAAARGQRVTLRAAATARGYAKASAGWWVQPR